jgi:hypothetical protein
MERFDSNGRFLSAEINHNGNIILTNMDTTITPKNNIIYSQVKSSNLSKNYINTIKLERTNTRIKYDCSKCKNDIALVVRILEKIFYICSNVDCDEVLCLA